MFKLFQIINHSNEQDKACRVGSLWCSSRLKSTFKNMMLTYISKGLSKVALDNFEGTNILIKYDNNND